MSHPAAHTQSALTPLLAILGTVVLWASAYPAIAIALDGFSPRHLAALRYVIASLALLGIGVASRIGLPKRVDIPRIAAVGLVGITAYNLLLNIGQTTVSAGTAGLLINVNSVFAAILAYIFLNERLRPAGWFGIAMALAGAAIIAHGRGVSSSELDWGSLYILAAALCFALQWILQKPLLAHYRPLAVATWAIWSGTIFLLPFLLGAGSELSDAAPRALMALVFLGLGPAALAYAMWAYGLAYYPVVRATSFLYLVAPAVLLLSYLALGEIPAPATLIGGVLTLSGVILVNTLGRQPHRSVAGKPNATTAARR